MTIDDCRLTIGGLTIDDWPIDDWRIDDWPLLMAIGELEEFVMSDVVITAGEFRFEAAFETQAAPRTCAAFRALLPFKQSLVHVRWSGEAMWVPLGDLELGLAPENATSYPRPGEVILYPGGVSETEILIAYGYTNFASKAGQLAGNHFLTIVSGLDRLASLGKATLWKGAHAVVIDRL